MSKNSYPTESAKFDMDIINIHRQFRDQNKSKEDAWNYIENNYNIMDIGCPTYDLIDMVWNNQY
jgi:hypothetical protein